MKRRVLSVIIFVPLLAAMAAACGAADDAEDFGIDEELGPVGPMGKDDGAGRPGPLVATNTTATQVWTARNKWEDRDTPEARKAGMAWDENSGLNWDEKYVRWIDSLRIVPGAAGYQTIELTTPWGKTVVAPVLECAETGIFLRATFAAWYGLPFMMESVSASGQRVYFGHFGIRTATGKYGSTPSFATAYKDYSSWTAADLAARGWPKDAGLRARAAAGGDDQQLIAGGGHFGAYLDEVHLNKRAGHFIINQVNYFGSANLADAANTYNLVPEAIRPGDLLLHRWQRTGIGDTKIVKAVGRTADGTMTARLMSGSMPRRQPKVYDETASKGYFTQDDTGGPGENYDGDAYWKLGGGVKRWRVTKNVGGRWTNTWMAADEASWINDQDQARISARPARFEALLHEVTPAEKREALVAQINDARAHLLRYPASCAARERRERAFAELYALAPRLGTTRAQLDRDLRTLDDYVFAELEYSHAKTCCWNSSTSAMAEIILDYAEKEQADATAAGMCVAPTIFRNEGGSGGDYARWQGYAAATGRGALWRAWSEDESCPQRDVAEDALREGEAEPWCAIQGGGGGGGGGGACTDAYEPNETAGGARAVGPGTYAGRVCAGDQDFYAVTVTAGGALTAKIAFSHAEGDLDLELLAPGGARVAISESTSDSESVSASGLAAGTYVVRVYGYAGAQGAYSLVVP
jgi:hypothetical protein